MNQNIIIGIINAKGGVGKTTSTMHLGLALADRGVEVWDADPQGSATTWAQSAEEDNETLPFEVLSVNIPQIQKRKTTARFTIIDSPPQNEAILAAIAERADVCIIPTAPTGTDIERVFPTVDSLPGGKAAIVLLTDADPRTVLFREAAQVLEQEGLAVFDQAIPPRQAVRAAYGRAPKNLSGYEEVAKELLELMEVSEK